jgi:hypothetical protein
MTQLSRIGGWDQHQSMVNLHIKRVHCKTFNHPRLHSQTKRTELDVEHFKLDYFVWQSLMFVLDGAFIQI